MVADVSDNEQAALEREHERIAQMEDDLAQKVAEESGMAIEEARQFVSLEVNRRMALIRQRRRIERMYDAALEEAAEVGADLKRATEELTRAYVTVCGMSWEEARYRARTLH